jgi:hypothetical protein
MRERATDSGHDEALTVLIEGHALSIENAYVSDNFSDAEREQYEAAMDGEDSPEMTAAPEILSAQQYSPYVFGPTFVEALESRGDKTLLDAFLKNQPTSLEQTILPSKYFADDEPEEIETPETPNGNEPAVSGQVSQLDLFFLLVRTWGAPEALRLSDLWGNGAYAGFEVGDDDFCAAMNIRGETDEATDELRQAFVEWTKLPGLRDTKVVAHDDHFSIESCDPGPEAKIDLPTETDTQQIFWRAGDISYIERSEPDADAECIATGIYTEFTAEELQTNDQVIERYNELIAECRRD